jgi:uncharacterized membrane protein HdeD (DUF308 family)
MNGKPVAEFLGRFWWLLLLRGVLSILFGICAFAWPGLTVVTLVMFFAAYAFVDGVFDVIHAISHRKEIEHWALLRLRGCAVSRSRPARGRNTTVVGSVIIGLYIAAWPSLRERCDRDGGATAGD